MRSYMLCLGLLACGSRRPPTPVPAAPIGPGTEIAVAPGTPQADVDTEVLAFSLLVTPTVGEVTPSGRELAAGELGALQSAGVVAAAPSATFFVVQGPEPDDGPGGDFPLTSAEPPMATGTYVEQWFADAADVKALGVAPGFVFQFASTFESTPCTQSDAHPELEGKPVANQSLVYGVPPATSEVGLETATSPAFYTIYQPDGAGVLTPRGQLMRSRQEVGGVMMRREDWLFDGFEMLAEEGGRLAFMVRVPPGAAPMTPTDWYDANQRSADTHAWTRYAFAPFESGCAAPGVIAVPPAPR